MFTFLRHQSFLIWGAILLIIADLSISMLLESIYRFALLGRSTSMEQFSFCFFNACSLSRHFFSVLFFLLHVYSGRCVHAIFFLFLFLLWVGAERKKRENHWGYVSWCPLEFFQLKWADTEIGNQDFHPMSQPAAWRQTMLPPYLGELTNAARALPKRELLPSVFFSSS